MKKREGAIRGHPPFTFRKFAASLTALVVAFLAAGTACAQSALPGDAFYPWKLAGEKVWRMTSPDPIQTDIAIMNRRMDEMNAVADDPARKAQALAGYIEVATRLASELDAERLQEVLPMPVSTEKPSPAIPTLTPARPPKILPTIEIPPPRP